MERKVTKFLLEWKNSPYRKPLILQGARQVGKTYILLDLGKNTMKMWPTSISKPIPA